MAEQPAETAAVAAVTMFEREPCLCCSCCDGYCPDEDLRDRWENLIRVEIDGRVFVGTARIILAADRVTGLPDETTFTDLPQSAALAQFTVPPSPPPLFDGAHIAEMWDRIDRAGLDCRHVEGGVLTHLYLGDEHVGWTRHAAPGKGIQRSQLGDARVLAVKSRLALAEVERVLVAMSAPPTSLTQDGA